MIKVATECYIRSGAKTLMLHRTKKENDFHEGRWVGIGGKLEQGESPEDCIVREVLEECGLVIESPILRGILTFPSFLEREDDWLVFLYATEQFSGQLIDCDEGELAWIDDAKISELPMHEGDPLFIDWMRRYTMFSAKFIYNKNGLVSYDLTVHAQ